jgi:hypothetical protein
MTCSRGLFAALVTCLAQFGAAARADVIVADNFTPAYESSGFRTDVGYASPTGQTPVFTNKAPSQPFIPSAGGTLSSLSAFIQRWDPAASTPPLKVSVRTDDAGRPGAILGEQSFASSLFTTSYAPPNGPITLDLSSLGVNLQAGTPYHLVFRTDTPNATFANYSLHVIRPHAGSFGLPYRDSLDAGASWTLPPSGLALEIPVRVSVVPEPAGAAVVLVTGACGILARRRRR